VNGRLVSITTVLVVAVVTVIVTTYSHILSKHKEISASLYSSCMHLKHLCSVTTSLGVLKF
jgi:hypothetical protein